MAEGDSKVVDLQDLNPEFQRRLGNFLTAAKAAGIPAHIIEAYRSNAVQAQYYADKQKGLRPYPVAPPGQSFHNYGYAADTLADDRSQQQKLIDYANAHPEFGVAPLPGDAPHFQIAGYKHLADAIKNPPAYQGGAAAPDLSPFIAGGQGYSVAKGYTPYNPGMMVASNAATVPIAGALAKQEVGPEAAGGGATAASEGPLDVRQLVYNKLTGAGLASHQALGAVWSLAGESGAGLNPSAYNPKDPGGSVGIGQWLGPRRAALEAFAKARGTAVTDPNTQADFLVDELTNEKAATYQPGVFDAMKQAKTAADATKTWTTQFERPKVDNSDARIAGGANVASLDDKGNFVLGKGAPATGAPAPATTAPAVATAAPQSLWEKLTGSPTDAEGKPTGAKSPMQQLAEASASRLSSEGQTTKDEEPARSALSSQGPGARNVSPGLANIAQVYGQTLNSFQQPLTWGHGPQGAPGMPAAGLRGGVPPPVPGLSLATAQPLPQGLGFGIDDVGYGFG